MALSDTKLIFLIIAVLGIAFIANEIYEYESNKLGVDETMTRINMTTAFGAQCLDGTPSIIYWKAGIN